MKRLLLLSLMIGQVAWAAMPRTISYQGVLRSSSGSPIANGNHTLMMKLYSAATGGTALWTETDTVFVSNCTFHTMLGDGTALNLAFDQTYWLGITIDSGTEQTPRIEFAASPYAFRAAVADSVVGGGSGGDSDWIIAGTDMYAGVSGRVGIGTPSPQAKLEVRGAGEQVRASGATSQFPQRWIAMEYHPSTGPLLRGGSDYERLTIDANSGDAGKIILGAHGDKVGIGLMDPVYPLEVVGTTKTDGFRMATGAANGKVLTSDASGNGSWQTVSGGGGDITAVYADNGLTGGATSGDARLNVGAGDGIDVTADAIAVDVTDFAGSGLGEATNDLKVNTGTGLTISSDAVQLTSAYSSGSAYDSRFVNESQQYAITNGMLGTGVVDYRVLDNPMDINYSTYNWDLYSSSFLLQKYDSGGPILMLEHHADESTDYADCLWAQDVEDIASSSTWIIYARAGRGNAGRFYKHIDDNQYAVYIEAPDEGLYVDGDFVVQTGHTKSGVVETSQGREAIFCVEGPEVEIFSSGRAQLTGGTASVSFDRLFTEAITPEVDVRVTLTPVGGWSALYLESTDTGGFVARSATGDPNIEFFWMACGRREGFAERPQVTVPDPAAERIVREEKEAAYQAHQ